MKLRQMAAVAAGATLAATAAMSVPAHAEEPVPPWGTGQIYMIKYGIAFCLTVPRADQRSSLVVQRCTGQVGQDWLTEIKSNHLVIEWGGNTSLCVGAKPKSKVVTLVDCVGSSEAKELALSVLRYQAVGETEHREPIAQVHPYNGQLMSTWIRKPHPGKNVPYPVSFSTGSSFPDHDWIFPAWHADVTVDQVR
jgi:hypothetical protein